MTDPTNYSVEVTIEDVALRMGAKEELIRVKAVVMPLFVRDLETEEQALEHAKVLIAAKFKYKVIKHEHGGGSKDVKEFRDVPL